MDTIIYGVLFVGALVVIILAIRWAITRAADKGMDAIQHRVNAHKNKANAGKVQNLADRYRNQAENAHSAQQTQPTTQEEQSAVICPKCGKKLREGTVYCPSCGAQMGH